MKKIFISVIFSIVIFLLNPMNLAHAGLASQEASSDERANYLAERGIIMPPEEIYISTFMASINYNYPKPQSNIGINLYNSSNQMSRHGQEGILQIGIQGKSMSFAELPPMNLVFVVDCSSSMNDENKIAWVKESAAIFVNKVRSIDSLALVSFGETTEVNFASTRMDNAEKRQRFLDAVNSLRPHGTSDLEKGLRAGYQQALTNFRDGSVNRVFFFSDGTEFSSRLNREKAQSGDVRVSLIWNNRNDLDLSVITPTGEEIFFNKKQDSTGGMLDVDMNAKGETTEPVENIFWGSGRAPQGRYRIIIKNFAFHESSRSPTPFQVEIKNGRQYSYFSGSISGFGESSSVEVTSFEYRGTAALKQEKALIYQLAESYRQMGITTTTIGVGVGFDLELMQILAEEGGGSSRFISDRDQMTKLFNTEFQRMAVLIATDLDMTLEFASGIRILETWGYQNKIEGNRISYSLPGLHLGDYETILVRYTLQPQAGTSNGKLKLAQFKVNAKDLWGKSLPLEERSITIALSENAVDGISTGMLLHSGTMLHFVQSIKEIGNLYYESQDDLITLSNLLSEIGNRVPNNAQNVRIDSLKKTIIRRFEASLRITRDCRLELENAKLRLDDANVFTNELNILERYDNIISKELTDSGGNHPGNYIGLGGRSALSTGQVGNLELLHNRLSVLYKEIGLSFPIGQRSVAALGYFSILGVTNETPLLSFINENALVNLSRYPSLTLVERSRLDAVRAEQNILRQSLIDTDAAIGVGKLLGAQFMITGQVIPMSDQAIVFARVINVETAEILSAAQVFIERSILGDLLVNVHEPQPSAKREDAPPGYMMR